MKGKPSQAKAAEGNKQTRRHIWDLIVDNMKDVPHEDFAALPKDGLSQIDHYVYGTPKVRICPVRNADECVDCRP
jgi:hypothetical protein